MFSLGDANPNRVTEVTRRNIVDALVLRGRDGPDYYGRLDEVTFLLRVWPLGEMRSTDRRDLNLEADLRRHISWDDEGYDSAGILYGKLHILRSPDETFGNFLAQCLHPLVQPDHDRVLALVSLFNEHLLRDGFMVVPTSDISGHPVFQMVEIGSPAAIEAQRYDVSLSFASEQKLYVDKVASGLKDSNVRFYYAPDQEAALWGEDMTEVFEHVFLHGSRFVVMFISEDYARKMWPTYERRAAVEKALSQNKAYILPVRFDDTPIPGIRNTVAYVDARTRQPHDIVRLIQEKLARST
jgi:hypothetical protein